MRISRPITALFAAASIALVAASCTEPTAAPMGEPVALPSFSVAGFAATEGQLLSCPVRAAKTFTVTIDQHGARYAKHGVEVSVPAGALAGPQQFRVTLPRSPYVEADIDAVGYEHFTFRRPVTVTFDYSRCGNAASVSALSVWYLADDTRALLEPMPTLVDARAKTITFQTTHLSGYGLAYRAPVKEPADTTGE